MMKTLKILNLIFFILTIGVNALANILPLGVGNTGEISSKYPNLFTPAPITFSIWGLIYILLALFVIYQLALFDNTVLADTLVELIGPWFIVSCIMNIGWIFSWHYDVTWLSLLFIIGLLLSLIVITSNILPSDVIKASGMSDLPVSTVACIAAFDIYLGWITAATIANVSVLLVKLKWTQFGLSPLFWMVVILIVGAILAVLFIITKERYLSALAIVWAYSGILIKHISKNGYGGQYPLIIAVAIACIVIILSTGLVKAIMTSNVIS